MSRLTRGMALLMMCLLPLSMMQAEIQGAMLYSKGLVKINGNIARATAPIKAGDSLQTAADATAQIVADGTFVQVQPSSAVLYHKSSITVQDGVATVASAKDLTGQVASLRVNGATPTGVRYALRNQAGRVQVAALLGSVTVRGNNALNVTLKAGEVYTLDENRAADATDPQNDNRTTFLNDNTGLIIIVTAAIVAGVTLGVINAKNVSPAGP